MPDKQYVVQTSDKSKKTTLILCAIGFLGLGGLHDFYLGKIGLGLVKLITLNFFVIGSIVDILKIANGTYTDGAGVAIRK